MAQRQGKETAMEKVREILRLGLTNGLSQREIAKSCSVSTGTVNKYLNEAQRRKLNYDDVASLGDHELKTLIGAPITRGRRKESAEPDVQAIHLELKKKNVTLQLLHDEYLQEHPEGYRRTQFCYIYRQWAKTLNLSMRQTHVGGEKLFVDYAGHTVEIHNPQNGSVRTAQIFVAVLGASNYTYAEATASQSVKDWLGSHIRAFEYFGGVPRVVVPDNLKAGVSKVCRFEPELNHDYLQLAKHYGVAVFPARVRKPKDKAKVEVGVQIVERWILAALRKRKFFSLNELNDTIRHLLKKLNEKSFNKLPGNRKSWFYELDQPALQPLPSSRFLTSETKKARVNIDYHVELDHHYYSVHHSLVQQEVMLQFTDETVEVFHQNKRVASHRRSRSPGRHTTVKEHMPRTHREHLEWNPTRIVNWSKTVGPFVGKLVEEILNSREYPEQGYRSALGIMNLAKTYSNQRLEAACKRALTHGGTSFRSVQNILKRGLDHVTFEVETPSLPENHDNVRGPEYYN